MDEKDGSGSKDEEGPPLSEGATSTAETRGKRAPLSGSGGATGAGASAGGGGGSEDFDSDPQAGGGSFSFNKARPAPDDGADASQHGSR